MELLASGRDGDIYALSPGLVLRRTRDGRSLAGEARNMQYAHDQGYPVPALHELRADDTELVMERVEGPLMLDAMLKPWKMAYYLRMLADLLDQLHEIPGPDFVPQLDDGGDITLVKVEDNNIYVKLVGACSTCPSSIMTMKLGVEALLKEEFPSMKELIDISSLPA